MRKRIPSAVMSKGPGRATPSFFRIAFRRPGERKRAVAADQTIRSNRPGSRSLKRVSVSRSGCAWLAGEGEPPPEIGDAFMMRSERVRGGLAGIGRLRARFLVENGPYRAR